MTPLQQLLELAHQPHDIHPVWPCHGCGYHVAADIRGTTR